MGGSSNPSQRQKKKNKLERCDLMKLEIEYINRESKFEFHFLAPPFLEAPAFFAWLLFAPLVPFFAPALLAPVALFFPPAVLRAFTAAF
jgi:hypothetical protein